MQELIWNLLSKVLRRFIARLPEFAFFNIISSVTSLSHSLHPSASILTWTQTMGTTTLRFSGRMTKSITPTNAHHAWLKGARTG